MNIFENDDIQDKLEHMRKVQKEKKARAKTLPELGEMIQRIYRNWQMSLHAATLSQQWSDFKKEMKLADAQPFHLQPNQQKIYNVLDSRIL
jgi:hypothetical protein